MTAQTFGVSVPMCWRNPFVGFWLLLVLTACAAGGHVIRWETASEVNTAGFHLYRGPTATGPWERVNATLIPSAADGVTGGRYTFRDTTADPTVTYYYQLEEVELDGTTHRYEAVISPGDERRGSWGLWLAALVAAVGLGWWSGSRVSWRRQRTP
jgi:hypothetical protein